MSYESLLAVLVLCYNYKLKKLNSLSQYNIILMTLINVYSYDLFKVSSCIMYSVVKLRYLVFLNFIFIDIFGYIDILLKLKICILSKTREICKDLQFSGLLLYFKSKIM